MRLKKVHKYVLAIIILAPMQWWFNLFAVYGIYFILATIAAGGYALYYNVRSGTFKPKKHYEPTTKKAA